MTVDLPSRVTAVTRVTRVTRVTDRKNSCISATSGESAAVTLGPDPGVTRVTVPASAGTVTPVTRGLLPGLPENSVSDQEGNPGNRGNPPVWDGLETSDKRLLCESVR